MRAPSDPKSSTQVLVAGTSPVNRVVVTKIAERCGLRSVSEMPDEAIKALETFRPALVIADGGASNSECDDLLALLRDKRRVSESGVPAVILLCTSSSDANQLVSRHGVDAVVTKPITLEALQPVIDRLVQRTRPRS